MRKIARLNPGESKSLAAQFDGPHRVVYCSADSASVVLRLFDDVEQGKYDRVSIERLKIYTPPLVLNSISYEIDFETWDYNLQNSPTDEPSDLEPLDLTLSGARRLTPSRLP